MTRFPTRISGWRSADTLLIRDHGRAWLRCFSTGSNDNSALLERLSLEYRVHAEVATRIRGCLYVFDQRYALSADRFTLEVVSYYPGFHPVIDGKHSVDGVPWEINRIDDGFAYAAAREAYLRSL